MEFDKPTTFFKNQFIKNCISTYQKKIFNVTIFNCIKSIKYFFKTSMIKKPHNYETIKEVIM